MSVMQIPAVGRQMRLFEMDRPLFLMVTRRMARQIAMSRGTVTADDVRREFEDVYPGVPWTNAAGAIFRDGTFRKLGYQPSETASRQGSVVAIWEVRS